LEVRDRAGTELTLSYGLRVIDSGVRGFPA
jgi:hypothetical protein